jgi:hypothetical protein
MTSRSDDGLPGFISRMHRNGDEAGPMRDEWAAVRAITDEHNCFPNIVVYAHANLLGYMEYLVKFGQICRGALPARASVRKGSTAIDSTAEFEWLGRWKVDIRARFLRELSYCFGEAGSNPVAHG